MEKSSRKPVLPLPAPARNFAARGISALIAPVVRPAFRRRAPAAYQIMADWELLAGADLSAVARPLKFAGGTLTLACTGPVAMDLQYRSQMVIDRLNSGLGCKKIDRLRFIQEAPATAVVVKRRATDSSIKPPDGLPEGALGEALTHLYQSIGQRRE